MFNMIIGGSNKRNIMRIAETMPSLLKDDASIDATTRMRIKSMQDEVERFRGTTKVKEDKQG